MKTFAAAIVLTGFVLSAQSVSEVHSGPSSQISGVPSPAAAQIASSPAAAASRTFENPLLPSGPDPWVIQKDGSYYYMNTMGNRLKIWKTKSMADLETAESRVVFLPGPGRPYSKELWAPELHWLRGSWYIYFAADAGDNRDHRIWVISNPSADPLAGQWSEPKRLQTPEDRWAIDATVFDNKGQLYLVWSGWKGETNGVQRIYIARMADPLTVLGPRVEISQPQYRWEKEGDLPEGKHLDVNEGPEVLHHGSTLLLTFSASACWTDSYALGQMTASDTSDLLKQSSWKKSEKPLLTTDASSGTFGPGHNSFFQSPDGKEDWIIYHANSQPHQGCKDTRSPRMQRFRWNADGTAVLGAPTAIHQAQPRPSGDTTPPSGDR